MRRKLTAVALIPGAAWLALVWGCPSVPPGDGGECAQETEACTSADNCCDGLTCVNGTCAAPGAGNTAALPAKKIAFDLIGIHDPDSDKYNDNCIACHGDRTDEVALDGATPTAHATMAGLFGEGNNRCVACHDRGPSFLTLSAGGLRAQVNIEDVGCTNCHGANAALAFYAD